MASLALAPVATITRAPRPAPSASRRHLRVLRFGQVEPLSVTSSETLHFPQGLVGMENLLEFVLVDDPRVAPCRWLQSLDDQNVAFLMVQPQLVDLNYDVEISDADTQLLDLKGADDAELWAIVTIQEEATESTVNLMAPVVLNRRTLLGKQIILDDGKYSVRHPLVQSSEHESGESGSQADHSSSQ